MATLTAIANRPAGTTIHQVTIELVPALPEDLKYFDGWAENNPGVRIEKLRMGMIYWLYSNVTNQLEPTPRIITPSCDVADLKEWLDAKMIFIAKNQFE